MVVLIVKADLEYAPSPDRLELTLEALKAKAIELTLAELRDLETVSGIAAHTRVFT